MNELEWILETVNVLNFSYSLSRLNSFFVWLLQINPIQKTRHSQIHRRNPFVCFDLMHREQNVWVTIRRVTVRGLMLTRGIVPSLRTTSSAFKTQRSVRWSRAKKSDPNHILQGEQKTNPRVEYMTLYVGQNHTLVLETSLTKPMSLILFGSINTVFGGMKKKQCNDFFGDSKTTYAETMCFCDLLDGWSRCLKPEIHRVKNYHDAIVMFSFFMSMAPDGPR